MLKKLATTTTKKGYHALWEQGGGYTNTGHARIICRADGKPKSPVYVRQRGSLACEEHALIVIHPGDVVIDADRHRGDYFIRVMKITKVGDIVSKHKKKLVLDTPERIHEIIKQHAVAHQLGELISIDYTETEPTLQHLKNRKVYDITYETVDAGALVETIHLYEQGGWDKEPPKHLKAAIDAAINKADCYHCREPHFIAYE